MSAATKQRADALATEIVGAISSAETIQATGDVGSAEAMKAAESLFQFSTGFAGRVATLEAALKTNIGRGGGIGFVSTEIEVLLDLKAELDAVMADIEAATA